ncbi:MAG: DUF4365 domain-containing protein [Aureispira sp.]
MKTFPQRPSQHVLDTIASKYLESKLPDEWIYESVKNDYGVDYNVGIVNQGNVLGPNFSIQLKGKFNITNEPKNGVQLKKSTLNYWNNRFDPTLVVIYCDEEKKGYYRWFDKTEFDLTSTQDRFTFKIDKSNELESINWEHIQKEILELFTLKHRLYHLYSISLSRLKNSEFGHIWSTYQGGKFEDTIEYCKAKIKEEDNILWFAIIAHSYSANHQYRLALYYVQEALIMLPNETDTKIKKKLGQALKINHASILAELGKTAGNKFYLFEAVDIWISLIEEDKIIDSKLFYNFANTCLAIEEYKIAEIYYKKSLDLDKNNPQTWTNLADVYGLMGDYRNELKCYQKAIKIDEELLNARVGEAIAYYHLENYKQSYKILIELRDYKMEWRLNYSNYFFYLSEVLEELSEYEKSIEIAEEGFFYDPGNINLINRLSEIYSKLWESNFEIKEKAKKLYLKRLQVFQDDLKAIGELVNIKISEGEVDAEIVNFVRSHIRVDENLTDTEIVNSFKRKNIAHN